MDVILPFWVIMRWWRRNVMNHVASRGAIFDRSFVGERGFFLPMSHTATRASWWPYMHFWTFNFFVMSVPGWVMPLYKKWVCLWPYMVPSFPPCVFGVHKKPHSLLLTSVLSFLLFLADEIIRWSLTEKESTQCSSACGITSHKSINHQSCDRYAMDSCQPITWWYHIKY